MRLTTPACDHLSAPPWGKLPPKRTLCSTYVPRTDCEATLRNSGHVARGHSHTNRKEKVCFLVSDFQPTCSVWNTVVVLCLNPCHDYEDMVVSSSLYLNRTKVLGSSGAEKALKQQFSTWVTLHFYFQLKCISYDNHILVLWHNNLKLTVRFFQVGKSSQPFGLPLMSVFFSWLLTPRNDGREVPLLY